MKKLFIIIGACLMAYSSVLAQAVVHPFVEDGKVWTYEIEVFGTDIIWEETYSLEGDTVISSLECLKLYYTRKGPNSPINHSYYGALFEFGGMVFYIEPGSTTLSLLYDFSSKPESVINVGPCELTIKERKLYKYRGENWMVVEWQPVDPMYQDYYSNYTWIEGVGPDFSTTLLGVYQGYGPWCTGGAIGLVNCKVNGQVIFDSFEFLRTAEIATGLSEPLIPSKEKGNFYDLLGRKLPGKPDRGIYIKDGKKVVK